MREGGRAALMGLRRLCRVSKVRRTLGLTVNVAVTMSFDRGRSRDFGLKCFRGQGRRIYPLERNIVWMVRYIRSEANATAFDSRAADRGEIPRGAAKRGSGRMTSGLSEAGAPEARHGRPEAPPAQLGQSRLAMEARESVPRGLGRGHWGPGRKGGRRISGRRHRSPARSPECGRANDRAQLARGRESCKRPPRLFAAGSMRTSPPTRTLLVLSVRHLGVGLAEELRHIACHVPAGRRLLAWLGPGGPRARQ